MPTKKRCKHCQKVTWQKVKDLRKKSCSEQESPHATHEFVEVDSEPTNEVKPDEYERNREYYDHLENRNRHRTISNSRNGL